MERRLKPRYIAASIVVLAALALVGCNTMTLATSAGPTVSVGASGLPVQHPGQRAPRSINGSTPGSASFGDSPSPNGGGGPTSGPSPQSPGGMPHPN